MAEPVLMYCVGATKAGTSWLYGYLAAHPECHFRTIKELHYFDAIDRGRLDAEARSHRRALAGITARLAAQGGRDAGLERQAADRLDWLGVLDLGRESADAYLDYLRNGETGRTRVIGDVTPAYGLLPVERLRAMAGLMAETRFVYLLRDPVERLWSHVRMIARRRSGQGGDPAVRSHRILERTLAGQEDEIALRCDYAGTLERLSAALDLPRMLTLFYEDLFGTDGIRRLTAFLGIAPRNGAFGTRVHKGQEIALRADLRAQAARWLAPQYEAVARHMGDLPRTWHANMVRS